MYLPSYSSLSSSSSSGPQRKGQTFKCPCCGTEQEVDHPDKLLNVVAGRVKRGIIRHLLNGPHTKVSLIVLLYDDEEPDWADGVIDTTIHRLRRQLRPYGWDIARFPYGDETYAYALVPYNKPD